MRTLSRSDRSRRSISGLMTTVTALCTFVAVGILVVILSYIAMRGIGALNLRFLVDTPRPVGEGGGIGNAIVGSGLLLLLHAPSGYRSGSLVAFISQSSAADG